MTTVARSRGGEGVPLLIGGGATLLMLGLPLEGTTAGRFLTERVFLVAALVVIALAAAPGHSRARANAMLNVALGLLGITAALVLADIAPAGAILLGVVVASLLWQKRLWTS
jgi:hypothetical protein